MLRWITAWRTERVSQPCPLPPGAALRHIHDGIDARRRHLVSRELLADADFVILGRADDRGIRICAARPHMSNDFRTHLYARFVPDGSGSRLEGRLGWRPSVRLLTATLSGGLAFLWFAILGFAGRSLTTGGPVRQSLAALLVVAVVLAVLVGITAGGERLARAETAHLRAWLTARLDTPAAPPPPAPPAPRTGPIRPSAPG
ncbi:hypothetical protein [Actinoplanes italicus]|uniref:hypothetical protein n=1 Tax=Actinoplanes italicus TaxID=113567 RepID=UPI0014766198|nr:hypothetical protein [Actinoplanes italicus]